MVKFLQKFVAYHGCGNYYIDGTRKIIAKNTKCIAPIHKPFWKYPTNVRNRVETRNQLKLKPKASFNYMKRYSKFLRNLSEQQKKMNIIF